MNDTTQHIEGKPWEVYQKFGSYSEADQARNKLLEESEALQVKVRWYHRNDSYVVKTRVDPLGELMRVKREEKAKRKKRLNKKRRKK